MKTKKEFKALQYKCRRLIKKREDLAKILIANDIEIEECQARITMENYHTWYLDGELIE